MLFGDPFELEEGGAGLGTDDRARNASSELFSFCRLAVIPTVRCVGGDVRYRRATRVAADDSIGIPMVRGAVESEPEAGSAFSSI
jgi:hypothetical protein